MKRILAVILAMLILVGYAFAGTAPYEVSGTTTIEGISMVDQILVTYRFPHVMKNVPKVSITSNLCRPNIVYVQSQSFTVTFRPRKLMNWGGDTLIINWTAKEQPRK